MSLTAAEVAQIMRLVEQSGFDELNLEIDGVKLSLRRGSAAEGPGADQGPRLQAQSAAGPEAAAPQASVLTPPPARSGTPAQGDSNMHDVAAPLLGTFYRAPKPGAPPFVEVGAQVQEDTVIGIIEVMKLMNTVRAGVRGTVAEVLVADGALAEYGETLLRVRKAG